MYGSINDAVASLRKVAKLYSSERRWDGMTVFNPKGLLANTEMKSAIPDANLIDIDPSTTIGNSTLSCTGNAIADGASVLSASTKSAQVSTTTMH
eukprot:8682-Heterococcus_DN1.PRE.2